MTIRVLACMLLSWASLALSAFAMAWEPGPCPTGSANVPCIEVVENGNTYHINGNGPHSGNWYGIPSTGEDFTFQGNDVEIGCSILYWHCDLTWSARMRKCQDSSGEWRIGLKVTSSDYSGSFPCITVVTGGFPWYSNDNITGANCPFLDNCDNFIPYHPGSLTLSTHLGSIDMTMIGTPVVTDGHLQDVILSLGAGASFDLLNQQFLDCNEEHQGCYISGILTLDNATSIEIH